MVRPANDRELNRPDSAQILHAAGEHDVLAVRRGARAIDMSAGFRINAVAFLAVGVGYPKFRAPGLLGDNPARVDNVLRIRAPIGSTVVTVGLADGSNRARLHIEA